MSESYEEAFEAKWGALSAYNRSRTKGVKHPSATTSRMLRLQARYQQLQALGLDVVTEEPTGPEKANRDVLLEDCEQMIRRADEIDRDREPDHELKTWPGAFKAVAERIKRHEVRKTDDRSFAVGQVLWLREWDDDKKAYTGQHMRALVTYLSAPGTWGLPDNVAVMSIEILATRLMAPATPPVTPL